MEILIALILIVACFVIGKWKAWLNQEKHIKESSSIDQDTPVKEIEVEMENNTIIFFASETGISKMLASLLEKKLSESSIPCSVFDIRNMDPDAAVKQSKNTSLNFVFILATYENATPHENAAWFYKYFLD